MNDRLARTRRIADAVLYEGYILYPYRKSAIKNRQRFNFGLIEPGDHFRTEVLAAGDRIGITVRFLQLQHRELFDRFGSMCERLEVGESIFESWDEAVEREVGVGRFEFSAAVSAEALSDGARYERRIEALAGNIVYVAEPLGDGLSKHSITIRNDGPATMIAAHAILSGAEFVSMLEYPDELESRIQSLENKGLFPVLTARDTMLASPIIMYDFPEIAAESEADYYDLTEIDELLALRVRTMTDQEKSEARSLDPRAAMVIDAAESAALENLHGAFRTPVLVPGDRVILRPKQNADAFDMFLEGRSAIIEREEIDFEGRRCYSVILEEDAPIVKELDKNVAHRFFFSSDEMERKSSD